METKNIHVLHIVGEPVGGIRKHIHDLLFNLNKDKFCLSYAYSNNKKDSVFSEQIGLLRKFLVGEVVLNVRKNPHISDIYNFIFILLYVKKNNVEIIHGHGAKGGLYARLISAVLGVKSVYTPHGGSLHAMHGNFAGFLYRWIERFLARFTDMILFESVYSSLRYSKCIGVPVPSLVNYNGIDLSLCKYTGKSSFHNVAATSDLYRFKFGVFGNLRWVKGQDLIIAAFANFLKVTSFNAELHIYGEGDKYSDCFELSKRLGVEDQVFFHGDVNNVISKMFQMDAIVIPSRFESFPYVAIESLCARKPILASNTGGISEIVRDGIDGIVFKNSSVDSIMDALMKFVGNPFVPPKDSIERFSLEKMLSNVEFVYQELASCSK